MSKAFQSIKKQQLFKALVALVMLLAPYVFAAVVIAQTEPPPPGQAIGIDTSGGNLSPGASSTDPTARRYTHVPTNTITEMAEQNTNEVATNVSELLDSELGDYNETYMGIQKFWGDDIIGNFFQNIGQLFGQWISELIDGWVAETVAFLTAFLRTFVLNPNIAVNGITNNPNGGPSNDDISPWIRGAADVMYGIAIDLLLLLFILCIWKYWADTAWRGGASLMSAVGRLIFTSGIMLAWPTIYAFWIQISNEMIHAIYFNSADQVAQLDAAMAAAVRAGLLATTGLIVHAFAPVLGQVAGGALGGGAGGLVGGEIGGVLSTFGLIIYLILGGVLIAQLIYLLVLKSIQTALLTAQYMFAPIFLVCFATPDTENVASGFVKAFVEVSLWTFVWVGLLKIMVIILASDFNPWGKIVLAVGVLQLMIQVPSFMARASISPMSDFISAGLVTGGLLSAGKAFGNFLSNRSQQWQKSVTEWGDSGARGARQSQEVKMDRIPDQAASQKELKNTQNAANGELSSERAGQPPTKGRTGQTENASAQQQQGQNLRQGVQNNTGTGEQGPTSRRTQEGQTGDQTGKGLSQQGQRANTDLDPEAARRQQQQGTTGDAARQQQQPPSVADQLARDVASATKNAAIGTAAIAGATGLVAGTQAGAALQRKENESDEQFAQRLREAEDEKQRLAAAAQLAAQLGEKELNPNDGQQGQSGTTPTPPADKTTAGKQTTTEGQDKRTTQTGGTGSDKGVQPIVTATSPTTGNRPENKTGQQPPAVSPADLKVAPTVTPTGQAPKDQQPRKDAAPTVTDQQGRQVATQSTGDGTGTDRGEHVANVDTEEDLDGILGVDKDGRPLRVNFNTRDGRAANQQGGAGTPPVQTSQTGSGTTANNNNQNGGGGQQTVAPPRTDRPQGGRTASGWTGAAAQVSNALGAHAVSQGRNIDPTTAGVAESLQEGGDGGEDGGMPTGAGPVPPAAKKSALSTFLQPLYRWVPVRTLSNDTRIAKGPTMQGTSPDGRPTIVGDAKGNVAHVRFGANATEEQKAMQFMAASYAQTYSNDVEAYDAARQSAIDAGEDRPQGLRERIAAGIITANGGSFRQTALAKQRFQRSLFKHAVEGAEAYVSGQQGNAFTEHLRTRYGDMTPEQQAWGIHMLTDGTSPESGWNPACGPATETLGNSAIPINATNRAVAANPAILKSPAWQRGPGVRGVARYVNSVADARCGPGTSENERDALVGFIGPNLSPQIVGACTAIALASDGSDCERPDIVHAVARMASDTRGAFFNKFEEAYRVVRAGGPAVGREFGGDVGFTGQNGGGGNGGGGFTGGSGGGGGGGGTGGGGGGGLPLGPQPAPQGDGGLTLDLAGNVVQGAGSPGVSRTFDATGTVLRGNSSGQPQVGSLNLGQPTVTPSGRQQAVVNFTAQDSGVAQGGSMNVGTVQGAAGQLSGTDVVGGRTVQGGQGTVVTTAEGTLRQGAYNPGNIAGVQAPQVIGGGQRGVAQVVFHPEAQGNVHGANQNIGVLQGAGGNLGPTDVQQSGSIAGQQGIVTQDVHGTVLGQPTAVAPVAGVTAPNLAGNTQSVARVTFGADGTPVVQHGTANLGVHQGAGGGIASTDVQQSGVLQGQNQQVVTDAHGTIVSQPVSAQPLSGVGAPQVTRDARGVANVRFAQDGGGTVHGQQNLGVQHVAGGLVGSDIHQGGAVHGPVQQVVTDAQGTIVSQPVSAQPLSGVGAPQVTRDARGVANVSFVQDGGGTVHGQQNLGVQHVAGGLVGTDIHQGGAVHGQVQQVVTDAQGTIVSQPVSAQPLSGVGAPQVTRDARGVANVSFVQDGGGTIHGQQNLGVQHVAGGSLSGTDIHQSGAVHGQVQQVVTDVQGTIVSQPVSAQPLSGVGAPQVTRDVRGVAQVNFTHDGGGTVQGGHQNLGAINAGAGQLLGTDVVIGQVNPGQPGVVTTHVDATLRQGAPVAGNMPQISAPSLGAGSGRTEARVVFTTESATQPTVHQRQVVDQPAVPGGSVDLVMGSAPVGHQQPTIVQVDAVLRSGQQATPVIPQVGPINTGSSPRTIAEVNVLSQGQGLGGTSRVTQEVQSHQSPSHDAEMCVSGAVVGGQETRRVEVDAVVRSQGSGAGSQHVPVIPLGAIPAPQQRVTDRVDINIQGGGGNDQGTVHRMSMDVPLPTQETHGPLDVRVVGGNSGSSGQVQNQYYVDVQAQRGAVSSSNSGMDGMIQSAAQQAAGGTRDTMQILTSLIMDMSSAGFSPHQMQDPKIMDAAARIYREDPAMLHTAAIAARVLGPQDFSYESTQVVQTMMDAGWNANQISRPDVVTAQIIMQVGGDMPGGGSYPTPDYVREVRRHPDFLPTFPRNYSDPGRAQMEYERVARQEAAIAEMAAERMRRRVEEGGIDGFPRKAGGFGRR